MLGCHNCDKRPDPGTPYEESACAGCHSGGNLYCSRDLSNDILGDERVSVDADFIFSDEQRGCADESPPDIMSTKQLLKAFSQSIRVMVEMKDRYPHTYEIMDAKLQDPSLSYSELAKRFSCRKQNVQYHLKRAVQICPELSAALLVDTRFSNGYNALKANAAASDPRRKKRTYQKKGVRI